MILLYLKICICHDLLGPVFQEYLHHALARLHPHMLVLKVDLLPAPIGNRTWQLHGYLPRYGILPPSLSNLKSFMAKHIC